MNTAVEMDRQRITCTSDDFMIENWESHGGYVHMDGVRVLGASGSTGVPVVTTIDLVCGSCSSRHGGGHYTSPAVLWGRYEHALDRPMYYFAAACPCPRHGCVTTRALAALEPCP